MEGKHEAWFLAVRLLLSLTYPSLRKHADAVVSSIQRKLLRSSLTMGMSGRHRNCVSFYPHRPSGQMHLGRWSKLSVGRPSTAVVADLECYDTDVLPIGPVCVRPVSLAMMLHEQFSVSLPTPPFRRAKAHGGDIVAACIRSLSKEC